MIWIDWIRKGLAGLYKTMSSAYPRVSPIFDQEYKTAVAAVQDACHNLSGDMFLLHADIDIVKRELSRLTANIDTVIRIRGECE